MRKMLFFSIPIFLSSCHKDKSEGYKFEWIKVGTQLYYDYYINTDTLKDYRSLTVGRIAYTDNFFVEEAPASPFPSSFPLLFYLLDRNFNIKEGGLYGLACVSCRGLCFNEFDFLYAPDHPSLHQQIPMYSCGPGIDYTNTIIATDTTVTVPLGTFKTYVMLHRNGDKSYWDPNKGIIMYEVASKGTLKLSRIVK